MSAGRDECTDDHSSRLHCPVHGFDDSVPPPTGYFWHRVRRADGQIYAALVRSSDETEWDTFRFEFDTDGTFWQRGREGWREAKCAACGYPIRWVLDMFSFTHPGDSDGYALEHASCAWRKSGFDRQRKLAPGDPDD